MPILIPRRCAGILDAVRRGVDMTDRHSLEVFGIWFGFLVGTILWILISLSGVPLSVSRAVFMVAATVFTFGAVVRALRLASS
jgi:hypothetical protein